MANPFRDFNVYKIDPLSEIRNAGIVTNGEVFWVSSTADSDHRERTDLLGNSVVKISLQAGIDATENDGNDYVLVVPTDGGTVRSLGTAVDFNKSRVHVLGVGAKAGNQTSNGLTFNGFVSANGVDTELAYVSAPGVEIGGLRFLGTSGTAAGGTITATFRVGTVGASGTAHDLWLHDLTIENTQAAAAGGTAPIFEVTGDVATGIRGLRLDRCWIGNFSWAPTPLVNLAGTAGPSRARFEDCTFVLDAQATTDAFVTGGTGNTEYVLFKNCDFINVESGTLVASAYSGAAGADTPVMFKDCAAVNVTQMGSGLSMYKNNVFSGTAAGVRDIGLSIGSAALISA